MESTPSGGGVRRQRAPPHTRGRMGGLPACLEHGGGRHVVRSVWPAAAVARPFASGLHRTSAFAARNFELLIGRPGEMSINTQRAPAGIAGGSQLQADATASQAVGLVLGAVRVAEVARTDRPRGGRRSDFLGAGAPRNLSRGRRINLGYAEPLIVWSERRSR